MTTMLKAALCGKRRAEVIEASTPEPVENWALVKVHSAPMCTEYKSYANGGECSNLGHEAAGEVVAVAQPCSVRVGDRVAVMPLEPCGVCPFCVAGDYIHCQHLTDYRTKTEGQEPTGTMTQYLLKPDWLLPKLPDFVSYDHGAMLCCGLGPTFGAFQRMAVDAYDTVLITGLGPVGLGGVINARYRGSRVIGVDSNPYRAKLAEQLGAEMVVDPNDENALECIRDATQGVGVDKAVDCSGVPAARRLCLDACRRLGHMAFVGEGGDVAVHGSNDMIRKGLTLHGCWHYRRGDVPRLLSVVAACGDELDTLITHRFPMTAIADAFEVQLSGQCGKVVLKPWQLVTR